MSMSVAQRLEYAAKVEAATKRYFELPQRVKNYWSLDAWIEKTVGRVDKQGESK